MFGRKKNKSLEPILDGVKQIQLYVCPSCGKKLERKPKERCEICGITVCGGRLFDYENHCSRYISLDYREHTYGKHEYCFCMKHYKLVEDEAKKLFKLMAKDETNSI